MRDIIDISGKTEVMIIYVMPLEVDNKLIYLIWWKPSVIISQSKNIEKRTH